MVSERRRPRACSASLTWFEVVVNDRRFDLVEVSEGVGDLHDDGPGFFLRHQLVLLQIEVQIVPLTELQHCAEPGAFTHRTHGRTVSQLVQTPVQFSNALFTRYE